MKRQTLGLEPREIAGLVEQREALLHGIKEGVLAVDLDHRITMVNDEAAHLLGIPLTSGGRTLQEVDATGRAAQIFTDAVELTDHVMPVRGRVLTVNRMPVRSRGRHIGWVATMRDRTEMLELQRELDLTKSTTDTLRAQAHEFSNRMHVVSGLIALEEYDGVRNYVRQITDDSTTLTTNVVTRVQDPAVAALLIAKASQAAERGVDLVVDPSSDVPQLDDALAADVNTVMGNLIDNAFDAAAGGDDPSVRVVLAHTGEAVTVTVRDSGPGVDSTIGEMVFTRGFTHQVDGDRAGTRHRPGHRPGDLSQPRRRHRRGQRRRRGLRGHPAGAARSGGLVISVLVVDDDFMVARLHSSVVAREEGFEVAGIASTGTDALRAVEATRPDLVLLDIYLPDMTGLEVLRRLREGGGEDIDVIVISAARDLDTLRTALRGGVFHYLVKPFEIESLQQRLREYAVHRAELDELTEVGQDDVDRVFRAGAVTRAGRRPAQGHQPGDDRPRAAGPRGGRRGRALRHRVRRVDRAVAQQHPPLPRAPRVGRARRRCGPATAPRDGPSAATGCAEPPTGPCRWCASRPRRQPDCVEPVGDGVERGVAGRQDVGLGEGARPRGVAGHEGLEDLAVLGQGGGAAGLGLVGEGAVARHLAVDLGVQPGGPLVSGDLGDGQVEVVAGVHRVGRQVDEGARCGRPARAASRRPRRRAGVAASAVIRPSSDGAHRVELLDLPRAERADDHAAGRAAGRAGPRRAAAAAPRAGACG